MPKKSRAPSVKARKRRAKARPRPQEPVGLPSLPRLPPTTRPEPVRTSPGLKLDITSTDYSYVKGELKRIIVIGGIMVALILGLSRLLG